MILLSINDFFKINILQNFAFMNTNRVSNSWSGGPDLGTNCLYRLSADNKGRFYSKEILKRDTSNYGLLLEYYILNTIKYMA